MDHTFKAVFDKHINIASMNPSASTDPSSKYAPNVPSATHLPIVYMDHLARPQHAYLHQPRPATAQAVPPNMTHDAARPSAPVASVPGVSSGSVHNPSQAAPQFYYPSTVVFNVYVTQAMNPNRPLPAAAPPQRQSVPTLSNDRLSFPGATAPYAGHGAHQKIPPPLSLFMSQETNLSTGQKRVGDDLEDRKVKRTKVGSCHIWKDTNFKPEPELDEEGRQKFKCSIDQEVILPESYRKHIKSKMHVGDEVEMYGCSLCSRSYTRYDAFQRHFKKHAEPSYSITGQGSMSAASASPVAVPTMQFTFRSKPTATAMPSGSTTPNAMENVKIEPPVDEITQSQDTTSVADPVVHPVASSSQSPDTLATEAALEAALI